MNEYLEDLWDEEDDDDDSHDGVSFKNNGRQKPILTTNLQASLSHSIIV